MGKLEKVGAAVVGVLLCIIVAVGVLNHGKKPVDERMTEADREANLRKQTALRKDTRDSKSPQSSVIDRGDQRKNLEFDDLNRRIKEEDRLAREGALAEKRAQAARLQREREALAAKDRKNGERPAVQPPANSANGDWPKEYVVKRGDLLGTICQRVYKTNRMTKTVLKANPGLDPRRLIPGKTKIFLPAPTEEMASGRRTQGQRTSASNPAQRPGFISASYIQRHAGQGTTDRAPQNGYYIVRKNDRLSTIAKKQLGSVKYTKALFEANRDVIKNPNVLREGWKLKLPNVN